VTTVHALGEGGDSPRLWGGAARAVTIPAREILDQTVIALDTKKTVDKIKKETNVVDAPKRKTRDQGRIGQKETFSQLAFRERMKRIQQKKSHRACGRERGVP